jgi:hypothetical protein
MQNNHNDDKVDAIAAVAIIAALVSGVIFWLIQMPW